MRMHEDLGNGHGHGLVVTLATLVLACAHAAPGGQATAAQDPGAPPAEVGPTRPVCVTVTGSRIPQCADPETGLVVTTSPVDVYGEERLKETGRPETGEALRALDPSVRTGP